MRELRIIGMIAVLAILIGGGFFFFGSSSIQSAVTNAQNTLSESVVGTTTVSFSVLQQGTQTASIDQRTNYQVSTAPGLSELWTMVYGLQDAPAIPTIDFTKYDVIGVFDGSHSTGGYTIQIASIQDAGGIRTVTITHDYPDSSCSVSQSQTSPFEIVEVPKSEFTLKHVDIEGTSACN